MTASSYAWLGYRQTNVPARPGIDRASGLLSAPAQSDSPGGIRIKGHGYRTADSGLSQDQTGLIATSLDSRFQSVRLKVRIATDHFPVSGITLLRYAYPLTPKPFPFEIAPAQSAYALPVDRLSHLPAIAQFRTPESTHAMLWTRLTA